MEWCGTKIQKYFAIHFTCSESCALSKLNCSHQKSIVTQNKWIVSNKNVSYKWLLMAAIEFTQSTWFTTSKVNCKIFLKIYFQFTFSCNSLAHDPDLEVYYTLNERMKEIIICMYILLSTYTLNKVFYLMYLHQNNEKSLSQSSMQPYSLQ